MSKREALEAEAALARYLLSTPLLWPDETRVLEEALRIIRRYAR